jgi:hypothetical protein
LTSATEGENSEKGTFPPVGKDGLYFLEKINQSNGKDKLLRRKIKSPTRAF